MQFINSIHNHFMTRVSWNLRSCGYGAYVTTIETATATVTRTSTEKKRPLLRKTKILAFSRRLDSGGWREMKSGGEKRKPSLLTPTPSLLTPTPSLLTPTPLYLLPPPLSSLPHPLSLYPHPLSPNPTPLSLPLPYPSLVFFLTFRCSVPLSERLKQTNFSTFRFRHCTTTKWNFLTSNFKFYGKRRHQMKFLLFFPRTWMRFLRIQLQKYSPRFDKFSRSNVFTAMNFKTAQIPFFTLTF